MGFGVQGLAGGGWGTGSSWWGLGGQGLAGWGTGSSWLGFRV